MQPDDDFDAVAARCADSDEGEGDAGQVGDVDKPGFVRWAAALSTRPAASARRCCVGHWEAAERAVCLTTPRGKKQLVMGHSAHGARWLRAEEALFLLDDGALRLRAQHPTTGADLRPGLARAADAARASGEAAAVATAAVAAAAEAEAEAARRTPAWRAVRRSTTVEQDGDADVADAAADRATRGGVGVPRQALKRCVK